MKYAMKKPFASLMLVFALLALAVMAVQPASAATLPHNFTDDNGNNFSMQAAYSVEKVAGAVKVVKLNGSAYTHNDTSGALYTKLVNYMAAGGAGAGNWYTLPGTYTSMNVSNTLAITCYGSAPVQTAFSYMGGSYAKFVPDNCAARAAIAAQSN